MPITIPSLPNKRWCPRSDVVPTHQGRAHRRCPDRKTRDRRPEQRHTPPNKGLQATGNSVRSCLAVRREAVWKHVETPLGIQVPNEPLERSIIDHSLV